MFTDHKKWNGYRYYWFISFCNSQFRNSATTVIWSSVHRFHVFPSSGIASLLLHLFSCFSYRSVSWTSTKVAWPLNMIFNWLTVLFSLVLCYFSFAKWCYHRGLWEELHGNRIRIHTFRLPEALWKQSLLGIQGWSCTLTLIAVLYCIVGIDTAACTWKSMFAELELVAFLYSTFCDRSVK